MKSSKNDLKGITKIYIWEARGKQASLFMDHFESFFELIGILEKFEDSMVELYVYEQSGSI